MSDLVNMVNHPGVPWGAGGFVGGLAGWLLGQPDCADRLANPAFECTQAVLPLVGAPADVTVFMAVGTIAGVVVAYVAGRLNR